jgi:tetratricopeptide (TPR) repeat protein
MRKALLFTLFMAPSVFLLAAEADLQKAISLANSGQSTAALIEFEKLKTSMPNDARVYLSLGLLYQTINRSDDAIRELERAVSLAPSADGYYALGLLYESKMLNQPTGGWKEKAIDVWQKFAGPYGDAARKPTAERHLQNLHADEK